MQQRLQTQQETFQRDAPVMGEAERLNLERQIRDGQREFAAHGERVSSRISIFAATKSSASCSATFCMKAQEYARAQKFDLLLADQSVIFASTAVDVTEAVLAVLKPAAPAAGVVVTPRSGRAVLDGRDPRSARGAVRL